MSSIRVMSGTMEPDGIKFGPVKIVNQDSLTSECWLIQIYGVDTCNTCEYLNTEECGGQDIRKRMGL